MLPVSRQHDRGFDGAAMNAMLQFRRGEKSLRRTEAGPAGGDDEEPMLSAQVLRDKAHGRAVAAMARDHDQLLDAGACDAFTERHPGLQRRFRRERQRAWIAGMLGGNPD